MPGKCGNGIDPLLCCRAPSLSVKLQQLCAMHPLRSSRTTIVCAAACRPAGRTTFSEDPTYLAALEAAARGSVLSATSGLASLSLQPGQQQQQQRRGLAGSAQGSEPGAPPLPPPKDAPTPPPAKGAGAASTKADRRKAAANESGASQAAGPAAAALGRAVHAPAPASTAAAAAAAAASAAAEAAAGPSRSGKGAAAASGQKGSSAGAKGAGRDAAREAMPARYAVGGGHDWLGYGRCPWSLYWVHKLWQESNNAF